MSKNDLVSKSVRLPSDLVEFVEAWEGKDFTSKLINLLEELRSGAEQREVDIQNYRGYIDNLRQRIDAYYKLIYDTRAASQKYEALLKQLQGDIDQMEIPFT